MSTAGLASVLPLPVAVPLAGAVVAPLVGRRFGRLALAVGVGCLGSSALLLGAMVPRVTSGRPLIHVMGRWGPVRGTLLGDVFVADGLGLLFALVAAAVGAVLLVYAVAELRAHGRGEIGAFTCLFLLLDAALIGAALTGDLFNLFVWYEVAALASYALTAYFLERPPALEAAFKVVVLTGMASFAVFIGAALLYRNHGGLSFAQLHTSLSRSGASRGDLVALGLLLAGFGTKAGLVPFHAWLPDAHTAAPGPVSALFSGLMVNLGVVALARIVFQVFQPPMARPVLGLLMVLGLASALVGAVLALVQDDLKRLLAWDTVSQVGVLTVALATGTDAGLTGAAWHLVNHAVFKSLLFLCASAVIHATGRTRLSELGGQARRSPLLAGAFLLGAAAIGGVPPLNGFGSRDLIHRALSDSHQVVPVLLLSAAEVVTVAALARAAWMVFLRPDPHPGPGPEPLSALMIVAFVLLGTGCVVLGVAPRLVPALMAPAAGGLRAAGTLSALVLGGAGRLPVPTVAAPLMTLSGLASAGGTIVLGLVLARWVVAGPGSERTLDQRVRPLGWLRDLHTGSVNDYATFATVGLIVAVAALQAR